MQTPRNPDTLVAELQVVNQLLMNHRAMQSKHPEDQLLSLSNQQFEHRRKLLLKELHLSLSVYFTEQV
jgi:hypothetical protein